MYFYARLSLRYTTYYSSQLQQEVLRVPATNALFCWYEYVSLESTLMQKQKAWPDAGAVLQD